MKKYLKAVVMAAYWEQKMAARTAVLKAAYSAASMVELYKYADTMVRLRNRSSRYIYSHLCGLISST